MEQNFQICTSYFYQIRNFKPFMVPLSTAKYDPKWFHRYPVTKGETYIFCDKNGVINGLRFHSFVPNSSCDSYCAGRERCVSKDPGNCEYLKRYSAQLSKIDINYIIEELNTLGKHLKNVYKFERDPIFCLMVYEAPSNACSERIAIQSYFKSHGIDCKELVPSKLEFQEEFNAKQT